VADHVDASRSGTRALTKRRQTSSPASLLCRCKFQRQRRVRRSPVSQRRVEGNLPAEATSFVGRRRLLADVKAAFGSTRLLTLVGPGGVGKTRLALRAAADLQRSARDGAWFVDLAGLDDPHLVAKTVMTSLGLVDRSGQWPASLLLAHLAPREALVVVDNCEHLLDSIAVLADVILKEAPRVRLLATSRQALGISGEHVVHVQPLTFPDAAQAPFGQGLAPSEAVALFLERAADAGVALELTDANHQMLGDLCRHLDGMPLDWPERVGRTVERSLRTAHRR
jgi:predicted ATPase